MAVYWTGGRWLAGQATPVSTVVTEGDRIRAVGGPELLGTRTARDRVEFLDGLVVTAGLWDSHIHLEGMAMAALMVDLAGQESIAQAAQLAAGSRTGSGDGWILGQGWNQNRWGGRLPHRRDLDQVVGRRPVALWARDHHVLWVSTRALEAAGWWPHVPAAWASLVDQDREGPTGIVREAAAAALLATVPPPLPAAFARGLDRAQDQLARLGIVGVTDMCAIEHLPALVDWNHNGRVRLNLFVSGGTRPSGELMAEAAAVMDEGPAAPEWTRLLGRKLFLDGALGVRTAWMREPYEDTRSLGVAVWDTRALTEELAVLAGGGWASALHAIGDAAVSQALDALLAAPAPPARPLRRVEHAQLIAPQDLDRFAAAGVAASMQAVHLLDDRLAVGPAWGERSRHAFTCQSLWQRGVPVVLGSDAPVETADPVVGMQAAVWRSRRQEAPWYPGEALTPWQALAAYTEVPARIDGRPAGQIREGLLADFTVWDRDPVEALERREPASVVGTVRGASWVWRAG